MLRRSHWRFVGMRCCGGPSHLCSRSAAALRRLRDGAGSDGLAGTTTPLSLFAGTACSPTHVCAQHAPARWRSESVTPPARGSSAAARELRFDPPLEMSHRGLAYAACPVCGEVHYLRKMLSHLTQVHPEQDREHCARLCAARLTLYEHILGCPLELLEPQTESSAEGSSVAAPPKQPSPELKMAEIVPLVDSVDRAAALRPYLPTVLSDGTYTCNWCDARRKSFPSRDAFLQHLAHAHPRVDFDLAEALTPQPSGTVASAARAAGAAAEATVRPTAAVGYPTQRLQGVRTILESNEGSVKGLATTRGISVPRAGLRTSDVPALTSLNAGAEVAFGEHHFPCELCRRVYASELDLLRHLESKHAPAAAPAAADKLKSSNISSSGSSPLPTPAPAAAPETKPAGPPTTNILVTCDLCSRADKIYNTASALFSHIRFRHPQEDAAFETERILSQINHRRVFTCDVCGLKFPDQHIFDRHLKKEHNITSAERALVEIEASLSGTKRKGPPVKEVAPAMTGVHSALGDFKPRQRFWCHLCDRGFPTSTGLYSHTLSKHNVAKVYPCPACKRTFQDMPTLGLHLRVRHHQTSLEDLGMKVSVTCPDCHRELIDYEALHLHAIRHHGKSPLDPVVTFQAAASPTTMGETGALTHPAGSGNSSDLSDAVAEGETAPAAEAAGAPSQPRKVTRRKKASAL